MQSNLNVNFYFNDSTEFKDIDFVVQSDTFQEGGYVVQIPITNNVNGSGVNLSKYSNISNTLQSDEEECNALICKMIDVESVKFTNGLIEVTIDDNSFEEGKLFEVNSLITLVDIDEDSDVPFGNNIKNPTGCHRVTHALKEGTKHKIYFVFPTEHEEGYTFKGTPKVTHNDIRVLIYSLLKGLSNKYKFSAPNFAENMNIKSQITPYINPFGEPFINEEFTITFNRRVQSTTCTN